MGNNDLQIVDARGADRFHARVKEPRPGVRSGHMIGSLNLPFNLLVNSDGTMKENGELEKIFSEALVDLETRETIMSCGSGVTACVIDLGL